jgi:hypothetical protein
MTIYSWKNAVSGRWSQASRWSTNAVPVADRTVDGVGPVSDAAVVFATGSDHAYSVTGGGLSASLAVHGDRVTFTAFANSDDGFGGSLTIDRHAQVTIGASSSLDYIAHDGFDGGDVSIASARLIDHGKIAAGAASVGSGSQFDISGRDAQVKLLTGATVATGGTMTVEGGASYSVISYAGTPDDVDGRLAVTGAGSTARFFMLGGTGTVAVADGGTVTVGGWISDALTFELGRDGTLQAGSAVGSGTTIDFTSRDATLSLSSADGQYGFGGTVMGFGHRDSLLLEGAPVTRVAYAPTDAGSGKLVLFDGTVQVGAVALTGDYAGARFAVADLSGSESRVTVTNEGGGAFTAALAGIAHDLLASLGFAAAPHGDGFATPPAELMGWIDMVASNAVLPGHLRA